MDERDRDGSPPLDVPPDMLAQGPLTREQAVRLLAQADDLLQSSDFADAGRIYQRVVGHRDADITAAALLGLGEALFRLDREADALNAWLAVLRLPETPATYLAWRNVAAARVRGGDLSGALDAYREAERRAPPEDRAEIASRLGWLAKETGDQGASRRWFAQSRGDTSAPVTMAIIAITVGVSIAAWVGAEAGWDLYGILQLDKAAVANGEYWRLWTVALVHAPLTFGIAHLFFNMLALWIAGPIVERFYGAVTFLLIYLLCAAAGSVASFVFGGDAPSVGASGAVFGLFGVAIAATRSHDPMLDRQSRAVLGQLVPLVVLNLFIGFAFSGSIDNAAHIGGLLAGLWLGWLLVPTGVPTLASRWQGTREGSEGWRHSPVMRTSGITALVVVLVVGVVVGTRAREGSGPGGLLAGGPEHVAMVVVIGTPRAHDRSVALGIGGAGAQTPVAVAPSRDAA
jgi:membrane associated rhomboid family serine protease